MPLCHGRGVTAGPPLTDALDDFQARQLTVGLRSPTSGIAHRAFLGWGGLILTDELFEREFVVLALAVALVASAAFAAPSTVGQASSAEGLSVKPDPVGGGWVQFVTPAGVELTRINEYGSATPVALPPKLRGKDLELIPLQDGWVVATDRYWPRGKREEGRCSTPAYGVPEQEKNCGVLVVAQYSPGGLWTRVQRLSHSSGAGLEGGQPQAVESKGRIELAWHANQEKGQGAPIAVTVARPGHPFGAVRIAQCVLPIVPESLEISSFRSQLYLRALYGPAGAQMVERRLYGDGRLGAPHSLHSGLLADYGDEALRGPHGSEILVYQAGDDVGVARRAGWAAKYQTPSVVSRTALSGFEVSESGNDQLLISVRSSPKPLTSDEKASVVAAVVSRAGSVKPTDTVEYNPLNTGQYSWASAIDDKGQTLIATVDEADEEANDANEAIWLYPSAPGCEGFLQRIPLIDSGGSSATVGHRDSLNPVAFAGPQNVFHLVWVTPTAEVQTATIRIECSAG